MVYDIDEFKTAIGSMVRYGQLKDNKIHVYISRLVATDATNAFFEDGNGYIWRVSLKDIPFWHEVRAYD